MNASELYQVLGFGIPTSLVFAICTLVVMLIQASQLSRQSVGTFSKRATIGSLSLAVSIFVTGVISLFAGVYVAAILIVLWFITAAFLGNLGLPDSAAFFGLFIAAIRCS